MNRNRAERDRERVPRHVHVKLLDGTMINGKVNICGNDRVSDMMTDPLRDFVPVFDATALGRSGQVVIVSKRAIAWVAPQEGA